VIDSQFSLQPRRHGGWFVGAVALLLVAIGLQAGTFRNLENAKDWYFGTLDYSAAALPGARKSLVLRAQAEGEQDKEPAFGAEDAPAVDSSSFRRAPARTAFTRDELLVAPDVSHPLRLLPDPTGPPRA
jgi:hypothetical protein